MPKYRKNVGTNDIFKSFTNKGRSNYRNGTEIHFV